MKYSRLIVGMMMAAAVSVSAMQGSFAFTIFGDPSQAIRNGDGFIDVVVRRGGGGRGFHGGGGSFHGGGGGFNHNVSVNRNVNIHRNVGVNRPGYNGGYHGGYRPGYGHGYAGGWRRNYRWAPGGAIAAGAAIGFLGATSVVSWAGDPPSPGLCWYYTDATQRQGFWDNCP